MVSSAVISTTVMFWIARLSWAFSPVLNTGPILLVLGFITAIYGAVKALAQKDARLLLAFSTVSQAGLMLIALGSGTIVSELGFIAHLFAHALAKAVLFLCVGAFNAAYDTSSIAAFREKIWRTPLLGAAAVIAALSMVGLPLTFGGVSKYWISAGAYNPLIYWGLWIPNLFTILVMLKLIVPNTIYRREFIGPHPQITQTIPRYVLGTLGALALLIFVGGLTSQIFSNIIGTAYPITLLAALNKAAEFMQLFLIAYALAQMAQFARWKATGNRLTASLTKSLALPDAVLAIVAFVAAVILIGWVTGGVVSGGASGGLVSSSLVSGAG
jgi:multicomponent Na+:H+ antiporter subunit D